jgi:hypothetical protein
VARFLLSVAFRSLAIGSYGKLNARLLSHRMMLMQNGRAIEIGLAERYSTTRSTL